MICEYVALAEGRPRRRPDFAERQRRANRLAWTHSALLATRAGLGATSLRRWAATAPDPG